MKKIKGRLENGAKNFEKTVTEAKVVFLEKILLKNEQEH